MFDWVDAGVLAGMSATMAFWLLVGTVGMGILTWRCRERFAQWWDLTPRDRGDAVLNVSLFGFLAHATFQRGIATYSFAAQEWRLSPLTIATAPGNLAWALAFVAGILWWLCLYLFPATHHRWWWLFILTGAWLGAGVSWRY